MNTILHLTYDGSVFRSDESIDLAADTRIRVKVESIEPEKPRPNAAPYSFFDIALNMNLDGPPDWSARLDDYLYGEPCYTKD